MVGLAAVPRIFLSYDGIFLRGRSRSVGTGFLRRVLCEGDFFSLSGGTGCPRLVVNLRRLGV